MSNVADCETERELLRSFNAEGSEEAFRQLVERHLDMVYHTALRLTANPSLAEEVTQNVFTILARKASRLQAGSGLGGWLHRAATYEASKAKRAERRRAAKMKELADHPIKDASNEEPWTDALPILDDAINDLSESDRRAILLRFFEGRSFRDIGVRLGKSEDASQKQVSRALDKLSLLIRRRGFALPSVTVAAALTAESGKAAPATLGIHVSQGALNAASTLTTSTILTHTLNTMAYSKTKTAFIVAAIASFPVGWQQQRISQLEEKLEAAATRETQEITRLTSELKSVQDELALAHQDAATTKQALAQAQKDPPKQQPNAMQGMAEMLTDPAMEGVMRQQLGGQIKATFGDLLENMNLELAEKEAIETMLVDKQLKLATLSLKTMNKSLPQEERDQAKSELKEVNDAFDSEIRGTYGDELADKLKLYEESTPERQELMTFRSTLASANEEIPFETEEALMGIMYEERKAFDFTNDFNDQTDADSWSNLTQDKIDVTVSEYEQLHQRILDRATGVLTQPQLEAFSKNQAGFRKLLATSMQMSMQMMGTEAESR